MSSKQIEAAGGVVLRERLNGVTEVLVVHRLRYDDWSLPKGKLDRGESGGQAALREVFEETGVRCELGERLPDVRYSVDGRPKRVKFWTMPVVEDLGRPVDEDEVDEVRWAAVDEAPSLLTYPHDVATLSAALELR